MRKIIPNLSQVICPLVDLTKKEAAKEVSKRWNAEHDAAFAEVKRPLTTAPVLHFLDLSQEFTSDQGIGSVLTQERNGEVAIVA